MNVLSLLKYKTKFPNSYAIPILLFLILGMLPGQAFAQTGACNASWSSEPNYLDAPVYGESPGTGVPIRSTITAGIITGGTTVTLYAARYAPSCTNGLQGIIFCIDPLTVTIGTPRDITTTCTDVDDNAVTFSVPATVDGLGNFVFTPSNPVVLAGNAAAESCSIEFVVNVQELSPPPGPLDVFESFGTLAADAVCDTTPLTGASQSNQGFFPVQLTRIDIEKSTNGDDADNPTGPLIRVGDPVNWVYQVTNIGNVTLEDVTVKDSLIDVRPVEGGGPPSGEVVSCDKATLTAGESMECRATGTATADQYENFGDVVGTYQHPPSPSTGNTFPPEFVYDVDPSHYFGVNPEKTIVKSSATQSLSSPQTVIYDYLVTNTGNVTLTNLQLDDTNDNDDAVCVDTTLLVGASTTCTASHTFTLAELNAGFSPSPADASCPDGLYNFVTATTNEAPPATDDLCIDIDKPSLRLVKAINGGTALPADFVLTLTGADGFHDSGRNYASGAEPAVVAGVAYTLTEAPGQVQDYFEDGVACVDDSNQSTVLHPVTLQGGQSVTCTLTNRLNEIYEVVAEVCIDNAPLVTYNVTTAAGSVDEVDITWIKNNGSNEVVETLLNAPSKGALLWPGAKIVDGVAVAWPGWLCDENGSNCTRIDDGLVPTMQLKFDINPTKTLIVEYPPATDGCQPIPTFEKIPANNPLALLLLTLMILAAGWYFRPANLSRF